MPFYLFFFSNYFTVAVMVKMLVIVQISAELITDIFPRLIYPCRPSFYFETMIYAIFCPFQMLFSNFFHCCASPSAQTNAEPCPAHAEVYFTISGLIFRSKFSLKSPNTPFLIISTVVKCFIYATGYGRWNSRIPCILGIRTTRHSVTVLGMEPLGTL